MFHSASLRLLSALIIALGGLWGCSSAGRGDLRVTRGLDATDRYVGRSVRAGGNDPSGLRGADRPLALVNGRAIGWDDLRGSLVELAGGAVLEELVLDRLIDTELQRRGLAIDDAALEREQQVLLNTLTTSALAPNEDEARRLLGELRKQRNLGDVRYRALLRRTAALRLMVAARVVVTPADLHQVFELRYGRRYRARIITVTSAAEASEVLALLRGGAMFSQVASERSTDASRDRGGLLPPVSLADTTFPNVLRTVLGGMKVGEVSQPIALEATYAIVTLDRIIEPGADAPGSIADVRAQLERDARLSQQRVLMDELARELLEGGDVTVLDRALEKVWRRRRQGERLPGSR